MREEAGKIRRPRHEDLRTACFKLRGLSFLLEQCGEHPAPPLDEGDAFYGVSLLLNHVHDEVLSVAQAMDAAEVRVARRKPRVNEAQENVKRG